MLTKSTKTQDGIRTDLNPGPHQHAFRSADLLLHWGAMRRVQSSVDWISLGCWNMRSVMGASDGPCVSQHSYTPVAVGVPTTWRSLGLRSVTYIPPVALTQSTLRVSLLALHYKLTVVKVSQEISVFYGTSGFITVRTRISLSYLILSHLNTVTSCSFNIILACTLNCTKGVSSRPDWMHFSC